MIGADWSRHYWMFECTSATCGLMSFAHTPMVRAGSQFIPQFILDYDYRLIDYTDCDNSRLRRCGNTNILRCILDL